MSFLSQKCWYLTSENVFIPQKGLDKTSSLFQNKSKSLSKCPLCWKISSLCKYVLIFLQIVLTFQKYPHFSLNCSNFPKSPHFLEMFSLSPQNVLIFQIGPIFPKNFPKTFNHTPFQKCTHNPKYFFTFSSLSKMLSRFKISSLS